MSDGKINSEENKELYDESKLKSVERNYRSKGRYIKK